MPVREYPTFVIAHRLATLRSAGLILVLQDGCIIERGTSAELIRQNGLYREMRDIQAGPPDQVRAERVI